MAVTQGTSKYEAISNIAFKVLIQNIVYLYITVRSHSFCVIKLHVILTVQNCKHVNKNVPHTRITHN